MKTNLFSDSSSRRHSLAVTAGLCLALFALTFPAQAEIMPGSKSEPAQTLACKQDLAKRLKRAAEDVVLVESMPRVWSDGSLGMPAPDMAYTQQTSPGHLLVLSVDSARYLYTCSANNQRFAGAESLWMGSLLFTAAPADPANLNATLYQCSPLGTNRSVIADMVTDFYPQEDGLVAITRRTSRSAFDLLMVKADGLRLPIRLASAHAYGAVALDGKHQQWAAFVKSGLGVPWSLEIGSLTGDAAKTRTLPLPESWLPDAIAWAHPRILICGTQNQKRLAYALDTAVVDAAWQAEPVANFPGDFDQVLNKSQTLVVEQVDSDGKPAVEVAILWFHGQRDVCARVEGLKLESHTYFDGRHVLLVGEGPSGKEASVADIHSGICYPRFGGMQGPVKFFRSEPLTSPLKEGPAQF